MQQCEFELQTPKFLWYRNRKTSPTNRFPAHDITEVDHHVHVRSPGVKLPLPGGECRQRDHQQEGPVQLVLVEQVGQEGDGLDGLPQTHLVSKDYTIAPEDENVEKHVVTKGFWHLHICEVIMSNKQYI